MPDDYLARKTRKLVKLFKKHRRKQGFSPDTLLQAGDFVEVQDLGREIIDAMISRPGSLVCFRNYHEMREAEKAIEILWEYWDFDQVVSELQFGGFGGLLGCLGDIYAARACLLRPTFTLLHPKSEVRTYLSEAMRAWAHGLDVASVILCWSVIENLLRVKLTEANCELSSNRQKWIATARERDWLDPETSTSANRIRKLRNALIHKPKKVSPRLVRDAIIETKEVVERLLH